MGYRQLTQGQRCQLYALNNTGFSQQAIANAIGVDQSTVCRELERNTGGKSYRCKPAQERARRRYPPKLMAEYMAADAA
jgi:IS30 family transposase